MRSARVEVGDVLAKCGLEVTNPEDDDVVETLAPRSAEEPLAGGVHQRPAYGALDDASAGTDGHAIEVGAELAVSMRLETRMSSFKSSPRMRSAPQSRFSLAMRWTSSIVDLAMRGGAARRRFDFHFSRVNTFPARCSSTAWSMTASGTRHPGQAPFPDFRNFRQLQ